MKRFPYFYTDGILIALAAAALLVPLVSPGLYNVSMALLSLAIFIGIFSEFDGKARDFASSAGQIKGLEDWDTEFFSNGSLILRYRGEKAVFRSRVVGGEKTIPVDYFMRFENGNPLGFTIVKTPEGGFRAEGGESFFKVVGKEIARFDESYPVREISNFDGELEICVRLEFMRGIPPSKEEKLDDMAGFLEDLLSFGRSMNLLLRKTAEKAK